MDKRRFLPREALQDLIDALGNAGFQVLAPQPLEGTMQFAAVDRASQLQPGVHDRQAPASYRLQHDDSPRLFAWANGPQAVKPRAFAPTETLWRAMRDADGVIRFEDAGHDAVRPLALLGVRACDLAALQLQDRHFLQPVADPGYAARRAGLFLVAVHCSHPADTCFCASTGDGPACDAGFDLALNELDEGYLVAAGSPRGESVMQQLPLAAATAAQCRVADAEVSGAAARQQRALPPGELHDVLFARLDHPRWQAVAGRCLSCGNCTSVCPTCFCHAERDVPALDGGRTEHIREWDSCFTGGHGHLHGFNVRPHTEHRYRQWLTHKLGGWHEQFGRSGCVGCGRCITWCPVGIDLTAEANAICGDPAGAEVAP